MNRILVLLIAALLFIPLTWGQQTISINSGTIKDNCTAYPIRNIKHNTNGVEVEYTFDEISRFSSVNEQGEQVWTLPNFTPIVSPGLPLVPSRTDIFSDAASNEISVSLIEESHIDYEASIAFTETNNISNPSNNADISPIEFDGFFPSNPISLSHSDDFNGIGIYYVSVNPVQYNSSTNTIRVYTKLKYHVSSLQKGSSEDIPTTAFVKNILKGCIPIHKSDKQKAVGLLPTEENVENYLIVTTSEFSEPANRLANWKRCLGFNAYVMINDFWTSENIKSMITGHYNENNRISYVLLLGDTTHIPTMHFKGYQVSYLSPTDYPYFCIDKISNIDTPPPFQYGEEADNIINMMADMAGGRIPATNVEEANVAVNKIIYYEQALDIIKGGYTKAVHLANFNDDNLDGAEDNRFIYTSEAVKDFMLNYPKIEVDRIYTKTPGSTPLRYKKNFSTVPSYGWDLPEELKSPDFNWLTNNGGITISELKKSCDNGVSYIFHTGHGGPTSWGNPELLSADLIELTNIPHHPLVISSGCRTASFENSCLGSSFILSKGGAISYIGASGPTSLEFTDAFLEAFFDCMYTSDGFEHYFVSEDEDTPQIDIIYDGDSNMSIGTAMLKAHIYSSTWLTDQHTYPYDGENVLKYRPRINYEHRLMYSILGDPSIVTHKDSRKKNLAYFVDRQSKKVVANPHGGRQTIIFWDTLTGNQKIYKTNNEVSFDCINPEMVVVTFIQDGYAPSMDCGTNVASEIKSIIRK